MAQALRILSPPTPSPSLPKLSSLPFRPRSLPCRPRPRRYALRAAASSPRPDLDLLPFDGDASGSPTTAIDVDSVTEAELKENGFRSTRRTKLVCTIGPATCAAEQLEALAVGGMNVARVNMCHGTHDWHREVIRQVRRLNEEKGFAVAVMMDTQGSEIHMGDLGGAASAKAEVRLLSPNVDVRVGDELLVDGGMVRFEVIEKIGPDVKCRCSDPGLLLPRANLTFWRNDRLIRERNAMLPTISSKVGASLSTKLMWEIAVIAKIESVDSLKNLEGVIRASDGAMVARGDMGAQIPLEEVPSAQLKIVKLCRQLNKPVIVASQLLESMIEYPTPTRAEVADVSEAVRQRADALMLSGESAMGQYPEKALAVLRSVSLRIERWWREEKHYEAMELPDIASSFSDKISEEICNSAAKMGKHFREYSKYHYIKMPRPGHGGDVDMVTSSSPPPRHYLSSVVGPIPSSHRTASQPPMPASDMALRGGERNA
ncbi:hypothetical protein BHM03_00004431, partial [Ensete ventricosum]